MCHDSCSIFVRNAISQNDIKGKNVLEVGSCDINGSLREFIEGYAPNGYVGVDIQEGPGVDQVCSADGLVDHFGPSKFDMLVSTEMLEHVRDWRAVISNFKNVLDPNGVLVLTTRSKGFNFHGYPFDFWRYEVSDMERIFSDFIIESLESDTEIPGVFIRARKPENFVENDLTGFQLYSIIKGERVLDITDKDFANARIKFGARQKFLKIVPRPVINFLKRSLFKNVSD